LFIVLSLEYVMRKFLTLFLTLMLSVSLFAANADAKRFGGGKSFGKQRESTSTESHACGCARSGGTGGQQMVGPTRWSGSRWPAGFAVHGARV
jgi:hypothetical protein